MRVIVSPHELSIGGSQINAIDLARTMQEQGHDVLIYGQPGPLEDYIAKSDVRFIAARTLRYRPAPSRIAQLQRLARRERADIVHAYEWPPCLDAYFGAQLIGGVPVVCTVLSMSVSALVPSTVPLIMGTEQLGEEARERHVGPVWVIEPPIDVVADHPGIDGAAQRAAWGVSDDELVIVSVSRLSYDLKLDALVQAVDAADALADRFPVRLVLVGSGDAEQHIRDRAALVNARHGRNVILTPGALSDPRAAYAAADVVVAMGSSALRSLAIGTPLIVQGEQGFSLPFDSETLPVFLHQGFWGVGDGGDGAHLLSQQIEALLIDPERSASLAQYGRRIVECRFSLDRATKELLEIYDEVVAAHRRRTSDITTGMRTAGRAARHELRLHDPRHKRASAARRAGRLAAARKP